MSPHGNPEVPASSATEINRDAEKVSPAVEASVSVPLEPFHVPVMPGEPVNERTSSFGL